MEGGAPMSPSIAAKTLKLLRHTALPEKTHSKASFNLSSREEEILESLVKGHNYVKIAESLFISPHTVRRHIQNIYKKLQITSKAEAIHFAHRNRWFRE